MQGAKASANALTNSGQATGNAAQAGGLYQAEGNIASGNVMGKALGDIGLAIAKASSVKQSNYGYGNSPYSNPTQLGTLY